MTRRHSTARAPGALAILLGLALAASLTTSTRAQNRPPVARPAPSSSSGIAGLRAAPPLRRPLSADQVRARADRIQSALTRWSANGSTRAQRLIESGMYERLAERAVSQLEQVVFAGEGGADGHAQLRATAAITRMMGTAQRVSPTAVSRDMRNRADAALGRSRYAARVPRAETAVEVETSMTSTIVDSFTTHDGTVGPVLSAGGQPAPDFLRQLAGHREIGSVGWDELSRDQKLDLLRVQSRGRQFFSDRRIPGILFRGSLPVPPVGMRRGVTVSGRPPADNRLDVSQALLPMVEYVGPNAVEDVSGVEFHVRQAGPAGRNLGDARTISSVLRVWDPGMHQHITGHVSPAVMRGDAVERFRLVDFHRRVNTLAEMRAVLAGGSLQRVQEGTVTYFDFMHASDLGVMNEHFDALSHGRSSPIYDHSQLKMAAVGFRTGELYGNRRMFGLEVRTLSADPDGHNDELVDAVQRGVIGGDFGLPRSTLEDLHTAAVGSARNPRAIIQAENHALAGLHYNRDISEMVAHAPEGVQIDDGARQQLQQHAEQYLGLKMLVHDWSRDPALAGNASAAARVRTAQNTGLRALASGRSPDEVVHGFVQSSGLVDVFSHSLGIGPH